MKKFRVYSSQIVYSVTEIEAESEEQARELAYEKETGWYHADYGDWDIETVEESAS